MRSQRRTGRGRGRNTSRKRSVYGGALPATGATKAPGLAATGATKAPGLTATGATKAPGLAATGATKAPGLAATGATKAPGLAATGAGERKETTATSAKRPDKGAAGARFHVPQDVPEIKRDAERNPGSRRNKMLAALQPSEVSHFWKSAAMKERARSEKLARTAVEAQSPQATPVVVPAPAPAPDRPASTVHGVDIQVTKVGTSSGAAGAGLDRYSVVVKALPASFDHIVVQQYGSGNVGNFWQSIEKSISA